MKLSEQLVEQAQWWMTPDDLLEDAAEYQHFAQAIVHKGMNELNLEEDAAGYDWNEARAYVCLFEAEIQKDIEKKEERKKLLKKNYVTNALRKLK